VLQTGLSVVDGLVMYGMAQWPLIIEFVSHTIVVLGTIYLLEFKLSGTFLRNCQLANKQSIVRGHEKIASLFEYLSMINAIARGTRSSLLYLK
jgi:hypothetical protein